jgi:hypothetical protein
MAVTEQNPISTALANGVTTVFPFAFTALAATDLVVMVGQTVKALGVDYTVALGVTGSITFLVAPVNGSTVTIYRDTKLTRATDYQQSGDLPAAVVNADFDRLWMALQEIYSGGKGTPTALRVPSGETINALPAAAARASYYLGFDGTGQPALLLPSSGTVAALALDLADTTSPTKGDAQVGVKRTWSGAQARTQHGVNEDTCTIYDALPAGFNTANDATTYIQAALNSGVKVVDFLGLPLKCDQVTVPAGVWAKNVSLTKFTNAAGNVVLVNTGSMVTGKIAGTGLTSAVQRGIYPAAAAVTDVALNVEVSSLTYGVQPAPISTAGPTNDPKRWTGYVYAHDIVGTVGASEGYGVLLESAESCSLVVRGKNIRRHLVYFSAGASYNTVDAECDGCGNYVMQFNASAATQPACKHNTATVKARNLTTDVATQSGALAIVGNSHSNTVTVFCTGNSTTYEAVRIEGGSVGVQADHPKNNKVICANIEGQFTGADVVRDLNGDSTVIEVVAINAYATNDVIGLRRTGTNLSTHGAIVYGGRIDCQAQAIKGIYNEVNTAPSRRGPIDIRNNGAALRVDDQTGGKWQGHTRRLTFSGTTASIANGAVGDTSVALADNLQTTGRQVAITPNGSSVAFSGGALWMGLQTPPDETHVAFRTFNGTGSAQTFSYAGWAEGD